MRMGEIAVNYLCVPFAEHFQQPMSIAHCVNGVPLVRRFNSIFKPVGDAWICKNLFESHISYRPPPVVLIEKVIG